MCLWFGQICAVILRVFSFFRIHDWEYIRGTPYWQEYRCRKCGKIKGTGAYGDW